MKVYTKTGDKGTTALIGGKRVSKYHYKLEAYGTVDELMSCVGLLHDQLENESEKEFFVHILDRLMVCSAILATDFDNKKIKPLEIANSDIEKLENAIDEMDKNLAPMTHFIFPCGHTSISTCHLARTVCRRCERLSIRVNVEEGNCQQVIKYLNRLSDYLFTFARKLGKDLKVKEIKWIP